MMRQVRKGIVFYGLTYADVADLYAGESIEMDREDMQTPGSRVRLIAGESVASMDRDLLSGKYDPAE